MIKIDVEGAEMGVLSGAEKTLNTNHDLVVLLDIHPHLNVDPVQVCQFLKDKGFAICDMKHPHRELDMIDGSTEEILARRLSS